MFDFTLPNSLAVLPVENFQSPDFGHALGQTTGANAPPPSPKFSPEMMPALGQTTGDNAPPPQPK